MSEREHSCVEHAQFKQADWVETHGLDCGPYERGTDEWWECSICHEKFTQSELDKIAEQEYTEAEGIREVQGYAEAEDLDDIAAQESAATQADEEAWRSDNYENHH